MKKRIISLLFCGLAAISSNLIAQPFIPGGADSAGLTYIVPDTPVWYNTNQLPGHPFAGYVTNGPIHNLNDQLSTKTTLPTGSGNYGNWEPYTSVIGDSTFMVGCGIFADDGSWYGSANLIGTQANQRYVMALQPAAGGQPKIAEVFYDDFGNPYPYHQMMRQRNPGIRLAGDKRVGAVNFISGGASALMYGKHWSGIDLFNTDGRLNTAWPLYGTAFPSDCNNNGSCGAAGTSDSQWVFLQTFSLNPATLAQTPLAKAFEPIFYPAWTNSAPPRLCAAAGLSPCGDGFTAERNVAYFGGDTAALSDGNFVVVADEYTGFFGGSTTAANTVAKVIRPDGTVVKGTFLVDPREIWANVAAYRGGFCVRVQTLLYFFDNAGNPVATNTLASGTIAGAGGFDAGRGDGTRIASDIRSHYVYLAGSIAAPGGGIAVGLAIWDATSGAFVTNAVVSSDLDATVTVADRTSLAVDATDRICVAFNGKPDSGVFAGNTDQIIARVLKFDGANVTYLTPSFFPFKSADNAENITANTFLGFRTANPSVAMTTKAICIAAKATVNSTNNPAGGPDSGLETTVYTVITQPPFIPGGVDSVGLTHIVPDTIVWYSLSQNRLKIGGFVVGDDVANGGAVEGFASVLGDSTFLLSASTKAADGVSMRFTSVYQPAAGGAAKVGDLFYDDSGRPYTNKINESRQDGNPGRVAGDPRVGAVNFMGGGEVSLWAYPTFFNSDGRFDVSHPFYAYMAAGNARDACIQVFSLNPSTLEQTMVSKAQDSAFGRQTNSTPPAGASTDQLSRFGGHIQGLDNGNFVSVVEDRSRLNNAAGNASVATIFAPNGSIVKEAFKVADADQWANVAAFKGGFCVRPSGGNLYFYDNAGNLQGSVNHNTSSELTFDNGRGDGTRIASDIRSHYVFLAGRAPDNATGPVWLAVWDANTREFVAKAPVSDTDTTLHALDRVSVAADALNRVCVTFRLRPIATDFSNQQVAARVMKFDGVKITYLTDSFFPFLNHDEVAGANNFITQESSVAMTTRQIFIYAEGTVNSTNNPASTADTLAQTHVYTVISHPDPQPTPGGAPLTITSATRNLQQLKVDWSGGTGPYTVQKKANLTDADWVDVITTSATTANVPIEGQAGFIRVVNRVQFTVTMNGASERPTPITTAGTGSGTLTLDGNTLAVNITYSGLTGTVSAGHIHGPATTEQAVGVIKGLIPGLGTTGATSGTISGTTTVNTATANYMVQGLTYVNIHTSFQGGGEIRGQVTIKL